MWSQPLGGFGWPQQQQQQQWPGMPAHNPTPQSTDPVEWAAKAAEWAQQRQIQDQYYHQQAVADQQQQQQQLMQQQQVYQMEQVHGQQQFQQQPEYAAQPDVWSQQAMQQLQQQVVQQAPGAKTALLPKPLFEAPPVQQSHSPHVRVEAGGNPSNHPSFHGSPHSSGEETGNFVQSSAAEQFPHQQRGPRGFGPRGGGGDFSPGDRFLSPRGRGGFARPRFAPRGSPPFHHPHGEIGGGRSPHIERIVSGHHGGGPTAEKFDRGSNFDGQEGNRAQGGGFAAEQGKPSRYVEQLEAAKQKELEKERELKQKLQRMQEIERQRNMEIEKKKLEIERRQKEEREREEKRRCEEQQAAKRAKQLEQLQQKRLEEEAIAKREAEELKKKRQLDMQLAQEIENKRREMQRILEVKERMERELMERQAQLGRMGRGEGEGWGVMGDYQSEQGFPGQESADGPTIPSWSGDPGSIPGLGELERKTETGILTVSEHPAAVEEKQTGNQPTGSQGQPPGSGEDKSQMVESLGKIVSQLQTLQGLTSSLKLLQTMPKEGGVSEKEKAAMREKELSEDTKRKVAALLANESDSDGEKEPPPKPGRKEADDSPTATAREFEGYNIPSQSYSSYEDDEYRNTHSRGPPPPHEEPVAPGSLGYSKFDYEDPRGDVRGNYGGYPSRDEDDYRYPPRRYPAPRPPPDPESGYPRSAPRDYPSYPEGGRWARGEDERQRPPSPPPSRVPPPRDYPYDRAPYPDPENPIPRGGRSHPDDYRGPPPPHSDPYYTRPSIPPEPKRGSSILNQMESIDYSHGGPSAPSIKTVDYAHGTPTTPAYPPREIPPRPLNFPSFGGPGLEYAGMYGDGSQYMGYGPPAGRGVYTGGLDPAAIFAAYQGGEAKRRTLPLWLREELEKLERKKAKQLEREAREGEVEAPKSWAEELERETEMEGVREGEGRWGVEEEEEEVGKVKTRNYRSHSSSRSGDESPPPQKKRHYEPPPESEEDKHLHLVLKIRQMLTEVLLEVTNQEIENVVTETIEEAKKPKLVIQMKGVANPPPPKETKQLLGLGVYSSGSESDSDSSTDSKSHSRGEGGEEGKSRRSSSSKSKPVVPKIPKPEEIAAAFSGGGGGFMPVPHSVQEKQRTSSKDKERDPKKEKKKKDKVKVLYDSGHESGSGRDKHHQKKDRKKSSGKDSSGSSRKKDSSSSRSSKDHEKDKEKRKEKERERGKERHSRSDSKHSPSSSKSSKSRRSSGGASTATPSTLTPTSPPSSSTKSKKSRASHRSPSPPPSPPLPTSGMILGGTRQRSRSRSPPSGASVPQRIVEIVSGPRLGGVATGKGSVHTTKGGFVSSFRPGCPPIGSPERFKKRSPSPPPPPRGDDNVSHRMSHHRKSSQSSRY